MLKLCLLWIGWCAVHSLLITERMRHWINRQGGTWLGAYRLGYVGFSLLSLLVLMVVTAGQPQRPLPPPPSWVRAVQMLLLVYAAILFSFGLAVYDLQSFLGLRQWRAYRSGRPAPPAVFSTNGILAHVRHPWYSGGIALLWAVPIGSDLSLAVRLILSAYLLIGTLLEERKLLRLFGEPYRDYRRRVPMLLPWRRRR